MHIRVGCEFAYETASPTPMIAQVLPRPEGGHRLAWERKRLTPDAESHEYLDQFGNRCWRFTVPVGSSSMRYDALFEVSAEPDPATPDARQDGVDGLPDETIVYTLPSRYVQSDLLINQAWELFGAAPPGWARVQAISDWIHRRVQYRSASSTARTTALDTFLQRYGVCRDFAHLGVAMCRAMNIPARYVFGYLPDVGIVPDGEPMDFHSWFEAWLGDRWHTFDARHNVPRTGRIPIGHGRDAVDVALTTQYGAARLVTIRVWSDEVPADTRPDADA